MKLSERLHFDDLTGRLTIAQTHDATPIIDSVARMPEAPKFSDKKHVARVPTFLIEQWARDAGVSFDNYEAVREIVDRKIMSGEFDKLRPWLGSY